MVTNLDKNLQLPPMCNWDNEGSEEHQLWLDLIELKGTVCALAEVRSLPSAILV